MSSLVSGDVLRVLLVSPHAHVREEVGNALQGAGEHRFYWVSQPDLALTRAQGLAPHIILVDDDLPADPAALVLRLVEGLPNSAVILLAEPAAAQTAQAVVLAGARAFLLKPLKTDEFIATLRKVVGRQVAAPLQVSQAAATGRVVVFCAPKGGTGRTTLAINTAVSLRDITREPIVVVDADYAAPAIDVALNLRGQRDIRDLLPKLNQLDTDLISSILASHSSGVKVLLAPPPDSLEYPPTLPQVQQVTAWLKRMFPWVLVDLGLPLDEAAYAFLDGADRAIMSVLPEMVGMRNAKFMLAQFDTRRYPPGKVWPLLNREGLPGGIKKPDVAAYLGRDLYFAIPNDQELATETINRGVPMVVAHRRRPVAQAYRKLAGLLVDDRKAIFQQYTARALLNGRDTPGPEVAVPPIQAVPPAATPAVPFTASPAPVARPVNSGSVAQQPPVQRDAPRGAAGATPAPPVEAWSRPDTDQADLERGPWLDRMRMALGEPGARRALITAAIIVTLILLLGFVAPRLLVVLMAGGSTPLPAPVGMTASPTALASLSPSATIDPARLATRNAGATRSAAAVARLLGGTAAPTVVEATGPPGGRSLTPDASTLPTSPASATTQPSTSTESTSEVSTSSPTRTPPAAVVLRLPTTAVPPPTAIPSPTSTPPPRPTAVPPPTRTALPRPTAAPPAPTVTPLPPFASGPSLLEPPRSQTVTGIVTFRWLPTGPLPPGAAYEVVWWNSDEAPVVARGIAPPTTDTQLSANLDPVAASGQFRSPQVFWTVLVVQTNPYIRLTDPGASERGDLYYTP